MVDDGGIVAYTVPKMKWWIHSELLTLKATHHAKTKEPSKMFSSHSDICHVTEIEGDTCNQGSFCEQKAILSLDMELILNNTNLSCIDTDIEAMTGRG